ncbi:MAG TPA: serine/threonine-protein kinase [Luteitalea sp.]|nr:serine/threonine-protein kinase [Luteitalea sp.]
MLFKGQTLGKYRILSPLGSGGFGTVYLARDTWLDKQVAIKVPHRQGLDFSELLREPRLLASVNHPNIVSITTAEKQDDIFFIVMEYVAGETLESVLERDGALDLPRALDYTVQIGNAVDHAHKQGVIHRDLRPANVLVSDSGMLKVADFGTSRFLEIAAHGTTVIGSPAFMAPEQFQGKAVFASDLYSVGVTMYQMLTGELPYEPPPPAELHRLLTGELVTPPKTRNPAVPRRLNDIVMKALAPQVADRYTRASDLLDDLLAAKPVILGTPGPRAIADLGLDESPRPARGAVPSPRAVKYQDREAARNCWHCRRPLHNLATRCPFCGEQQ